MPLTVIDLLACRFAPAKPASNATMPISTRRSSLP